MAGSSLLLGLGEIQEAIFEEKIFRIFFTQKKVFFLASQYKTGLYLDLLLENRIYTGHFGFILKGYSPDLIN